MLSLKELRRVAGIVDSDFRGHRVERWVQPDATSLALSLYGRSEEHTSELQSRRNLVCRLLLEKQKNKPILVTSCRHKH